MSKKRVFKRFHLAAIYVPESGMVTEKPVPGWRQIAKARGINMDENDVTYECERSEAKYSSIIEIDIRCGIPRAVVADTLQRMAELIYREGEAICDPYLDEYSAGVVAIEDGVLQLPEESCSDESEVKEAAA